MTAFITPGRTLVLASLFASACGLSLSDATPSTAEPPPTSASSSGGSSSGGQAAGSGGLSSGSIADAALDSTSSSGSSGSAVDAGPADLCAGKPAPAFVENGKCYWLSRATTTEANQAEACAEAGGGSSPTGVPFVPKVSVASLTIPKDYFIPGKLITMSGTSPVWLAAKRSGGSAMIGTLVFYSWQWPDNSKTLIDVDAPVGSCLQALPTQTTALGDFPQSQAVACGQSGTQRAVCQSK